MLQPWYTATFIAIEAVNLHVKRFWLQVDGIEAFDFVPGQFVTLDLPISEKRNQRWRSYSIASVPNGTNIIELVIVQLPEGKGTNYLFNEVQMGMQVQLRGPLGGFVLPKDLSVPHYFICTGTGVAPFRSMLQHIYQQQLPHSDLHLVFGCRTENDMLYRAEFEALQQQMPRFHYHVALSRAAVAGCTQGYVHEVYEPIVAAKPEAQFYLCGWQKMIDDAVARLIQIGYTKKEIHYELYG
ncbi:MAG TPA: oxidoreductase [Chitinophagaceae bacterium]|nr:oxidoreductase [Chitinophagaceae bacterium]